MSSRDVSTILTYYTARFLWVEFQLHDLCEPESDHGIRRVLQNLPKSLGETYDRLLNKIEGRERRDIIERMFKWIVCARQPLHVDELREGVAFTLYDKEYSEEKVVTNFSRLVRACSNLVVIDEESQVVQLAHYTVQQYLLKQEGKGRFHFTIQEANIMVGELCVAYLNFSDFETQVTRYKENKNTDMVVLEKIASRGELIAPDHPGRSAVRLWNVLRSSESTHVEINLARYLSRQKLATPKLSKFGLLSYIVTHWL